MKAPPRLLGPDSGAPDLLREALRQGRADGPSPEELGRLADRLARALQAPPPPSPPSPPSPPAPKTAGPLPTAAPGFALPALKIGLGVLLALGIVAGLFLRRPAGSASHVEPAQSAPVESAGVASPPPAAGSAAHGEEPAPKAAIRVEDLPDLTEDEASGKHPSSGSDPSGGETEAHLLRLAQEDLGADPARALARTEEHARRFRGGGLSQEREVIAITALQRLGRLGEARARAARFVAQFPTSVHRSRMEALAGAPSE